MCRRGNVAHTERETWLLFPPQLSLPLPDPRVSLCGLFPPGPALRRSAPWPRRQVLPQLPERRVRRREGLKDAVTKVPQWGRRFRAVTRPADPPTPGPDGRTPDMLCRAEPKAEPKRGSVLSSGWEHPPNGSGPRPALLGRGSGASQQHQQLRPKQEGSTGQLKRRLCMQHRLSLPSHLTLAPTPQMQPEQRTRSCGTASLHVGLSIPR